MRLYWRTKERDQQIDILVEQWIWQETEKRQQKGDAYGSNTGKISRSIRNRLSGIFFHQLDCDEELSSSDSQFVSRVVQEIQVVDPTFSELDLHSWWASGFED